MKTKKILSMLLSMSIALSSFCLVGNAEESHEYKITDEYIIIDSVPYERTGNTIKYNGYIYELNGSTLVRYDSEGPVLLILPFDENKITDPELINEYSEGLEANNSRAGTIPSNPKSLPYSAKVPKGQAYTKTPYFDVIKGTFYYFTRLTMTDFSSNDKTFSVDYMYLDMHGELIGDTFVLEHDFSKVLKIENTSGMRYGVFLFTNLTGEPSFTYKISLSNL